ncbi:MAG: ABC transporter substrate-binding protein, partial [Candidatus Heimdallarchaeota archaeon]
FTYYCMKELSPKKEQFKWIDEMSIVNATTLDILIDGDPTTTEKEPFAPLFTTLATSIIPEHYLNQTQELDGVTPDITHNSWNTFNSSCFGTGAFKIAEYNEDVWTTLAIRDDSWFLNTTIIADPLLDWNRRFGDYSSGLKYLKVRIISDIFVACLEFEAGKLDICSITELRYKRDEYEVDINYEIQSETENKFIFFGYNMREVRPILGDRTPSTKYPSISKGLAIRKALSYALDRVEINTVIHAGEYAITNWPIYMKMGIWCNPDIIQYNHDLDKARSYMPFQPYPPPDDGLFDGWLSTGMIIIYASFGGILVISLSIIIPKKIRKKRRRNTPLMNKPKSFFIDEQYEK